MLLSVVIPVRDEACNIGACARPLQALRAGGDGEIIVVDGGSIDGSAAVAAPLADQVLHSECGRARQMNAGAARARGSWLLFLHADTLLTAQAVEELRRVLIDRGPPWGRFDVSLDGDRRVYRLIAAMMNLRSRVSGIATGDQAMFVRRDLFDAVGGFASIPLMEDIALSKRLKRVARPYCPQQKVVASARRWEKNGTVATILLMWLLRGAFALGVSPQRLHRLYYPERSHG